MNFALLDCVPGSYAKFTGTKYENGQEQLSSTNNPSKCAEACNSDDR